MRTSRLSARNFEPVSNPNPDQERSARASATPKILFAVAVGLVLFFVARSLRETVDERSGWSDNPPEALARARRENKRLLMDFTGSDWCAGCVKLDKEVFATPEFKSYAAKNLVLLEVDFPRRKYLPPETLKQNEVLRDQYRVEGYPTEIVLGAEGKVVGVVEYTEGGPQAFISALEKLPTR